MKNIFKSISFIPQHKPSAPLQDFHSHHHTSPANFKSFLIHFKPPQDPRGVPSYNTKIIHVPCNHTPRAHRNSPPNLHPRTNHHIASKPAILTYVDPRAEFRAFHPIAKKGVQGMGARVERAVGTDEGAGADGYETGVDECAVIVDLNAFTESITC